MMTRHNTLHTDSDTTDSFAATIFPNHNVRVQRVTSKPAPVTGKKNAKNDAQIMEELQMNCEAAKSHLKLAVDELERVKKENHELRMKNEAHNRQ